MDYANIETLLHTLKGKNIPTEILENFELAFEIEYAHHSTAMEGNTLTLIETKVILEDGLSIGGKRLQELYEVINHNKAFKYVKCKIAENHLLNELLVKDLHAMLMKNIIIGGVYRTGDVVITGASHTPPSSYELFSQTKNFYYEFSSKSTYNPIELAAWAHAEFVKIHPFPDGNGRVSRLIMNYVLMFHGLLPVNIMVTDRVRYYDCLDLYASTQNLHPFADFVAELEERRIKHYLSLHI